MRLVLPIRLATAILLIFGTILLAPDATRAATDQVVTNCNDDAELHADLAAIQSGGGGTLTFSCGTATIVVSSPLAPIDANTTIDGGGTITLSGNNAMRLLVVHAGVTLNLNNITLAHAYSQYSDGGAVVNLGNLHVNNGKFLNNATSADWSGSAIYSEGPLTITNSEFGYNTGGGGAVKPRFATATTTITGSSFHNNESTSSAGGGYGGAMQVTDGASVTISSSTFNSNKAGYEGGALFLAAGSTLTVNANSTLSGNSAFIGGGISSSSTTLTNVTLSGNSGTYGGGFYNYGTANITNVTLNGNSANSGGGLINYGTATLTDVTLNGNSADFGGAGMDNEGTATLANVTFSGNSGANGGGIYVHGPTNLTNVTFSDNSSSNGGGFYAYAGTVTLKDTLLAKSPSGGNCYRGFGSIVSNGNNLSDDASCAPYFNKTGDPIADWNSANANLAALGNNGGFTLTHLPLPPSVAIDHGDACVSPDQRGVTRPQGSRCDIGAVEYRTGELTPRLYLPLLLR